MKKIIFVLIVSFTIIFVNSSESLLKQAEGQTSTSVNLINLSHDGKSYVPQILSSGNNVYLAWLHDTGSDYNVTFAKSTDSGVTFSNPIIIPSDIYSNPIVPGFAASGNNVYLFWRQYQWSGHTGIPQIYFAKSNDAGNTFSNPVNLSNGTNVDLGTSAIAYGNNLYFAWARSNNILFSKSTDSGNTFSSPVTLYGTSINNGLALPNIAISNSNICLVGISGNQVLFTRSTDNGVTFSTPVIIGTNAGSNPQIVTNGNYVYLSWISSTGAVLFSQSSDSGSTFSTPITVDNTGAQRTPHIAISGNNVYLTWDKSQTGHNDIILAKSNDGGNSFKIYKIDTAYIYDLPPQILASNNNLYLIWQSSSNNYPVFIATSNDGGNTLSAPMSIGQTSSNPVSPQMSFSNNISYLTLEENGDVFFTKINSSLNPLFTLQPLGTTLSLPLAQNQTIQINENTPSNFILNADTGQRMYDASVSYYTQPKIVDIGSVDTYTYSIVNPPTYGNLTGSPPKLIYTPIHGYVSTRYSESFTFKANDGKSDSNIATISIQVTPTINPPIANAGMDQTIINNSLVTLNGTGSIDPDYNTFLKWTWNPSTPKPTIDQFIKYSWVQTAGTTVTLSNKTISNPTFIAPTVTSPTSLTFVLTVSKYSNPQSLSDSSSVTITVKPSSISQPVQNTTNTTQVQNQTNHSLQNNTNQQAISQQTSNIPSWVKGNAKYWHDGTLGDDEFEKGIKYMIDNKIIKTDKKTQTNSGLKSIPKWIKSDAGWWADGTISQDDFLKGIEYLVEKGIINIS